MYLTSDESLSHKSAALACLQFIRVNTGSVYVAVSREISASLSCLNITVESDRTGSDRVCA